jgi:two-component sensor histidine kinase
MTGSASAGPAQREAVLTSRDDRATSGRDHRGSLTRSESGVHAWLEALNTTRVFLRGVRPAAEVVRGIGERRFLHSGPPLAPDEVPGPMQGAELLISDDGVGAHGGNRADGEDHLGRHIMRERAEQLGGSCSVRSDPGGTRVHARIPVEHAGGQP